MQTLILLWAAVAAGFVTIYLKRRTKKSGLVLAYVIVLVINYWIGSLIYILPKFVPIREPRLTYLGLQQTFYGLLAFVAGSLILAPLFRRPGEVAPSQPVALESSRAAVWFLGIGAVSYAALSTRLSAIPSATSLAAVGQQLFVVGLCLLAYRAWQAERMSLFVMLLASSALLPLVTVIAHGFLVYGAIAMFAVMAFAGTFVRPRGFVVLAGAVIGFISLSLFVTYIRDRTELRRSIWGGAATSARVNELHRTLDKFELFSPSNIRHLRAIDARLNLSYFTGAAVHRLSYTGDLAHGGTLLRAAVAVVPRALWPGKPEAGGNSVVTEYTGIRFNRSTSVGAGPVMEFYINFGIAGVVIGFLIIGMILTVLDERAGLRLAQGDQSSFALYFVLGLSLLQVGGSFIDVASTAAASVVLMTIIRRSVVPVEPLVYESSSSLALQGS